MSISNSAISLNVVYSNNKDIPNVPNLPVLPILCKYVSYEEGVSKCITKSNVSISMPLDN